MILRLQFPMDPQPKQRARVRIMDVRRPDWATSPHKRATVWTPERTASFEAAVNLTAQALLSRNRLPRPLIPSPNPAFVAMTFYLRRPKSGVASELEWPTAGSTVPDWDNLIKAVLDGLNRVLWDDDKQVCSGLPTKVWAHTPDKPRIELLVADLESMEELVRSEGESVIRRLLRPPGHGVASLAASLSLILTTSALAAQVVATR